jgi:hypothetical protein
MKHDAAKERSEITAHEEYELNPRRWDNPSPELSRHEQMHIDTWARMIKKTLGLIDDGICDSHSLLAALTGDVAQLTAYTERAAASQGVSLIDQE